MLTPYGFTPKGYAQCNGQLLPINQNQALFSLLGTYYGGDGRTTFALPNLQGQVAIGFNGQYAIGASGGSPSVTLNTQQIPPHNHTLTVSSAANGTLPTLAGNTVGAFSPSPPSPYTSSANAQMAVASISMAGSQAHENRSPYLALNWVIALQGIFPSRT
jgi:microcystin-dependent protein